MDSAPCAENGEWPYADGNWYPRPRAVAYQQGDALAKDVGCSDPATVTACLRTAPVATLLDKSFGGQGYGPAYGGGFLPVGPAEAIASGRFTRVPVMHGTTRDEHRLFVAAIEDMSDHVTTAADYSAEIGSVLGDKAGRVLAEYPLSDFSSPSIALATVWTDRAWSCPALRTDDAFATRVPTYAFEFADENAPWASNVAKPDFPTGAFHASDVQYIFDESQFPGPATAAQRRLSDRMIGYWSAFAHDGDPNGSAAPRWNRFQPANGAVQSLAPARIGPVDLGAEHRCGFWSTIDD
jgi:para-nitrobenzyl esterase